MTNVEEIKFSFVEKMIKWHNDNRFEKKPGFIFTFSPDPFDKKKLPALGAILLSV